MYRNTTMTRKIGRKLLCVLLCVLMTSSLIVYASAEGEDGFATEQPVLVLTGSDVLGADDYTAENIANEKAFTLAELKDLGLTIERCYSAINRVGTKYIYIAEGLDIAALLEKYPGSSVEVVASDGFRRAIDFSVTRYFYPGIATDDETGGEAVEFMLAWKSASKTSEQSEDGTIAPPTAGDMVDHPLRLMAGQADIADVNNSMFVSNACKLVVGDEVGADTLTALGSKLSRADVMLFPQAVHTYAYTTQSGERTTTVRGALMASLLADVADDAVVSFGTVDNYSRISEFTMTKAELAAGNAILAYEVMGDDGGWESYLRPTDNGTGYFRLMVDGTSGAHVVNKISAVFFDDLSGYDWAAEAIMGLAAAGYVGGKGDNKFAPGDALTRAEIVTILGRVLKAELPTESDGRFPDADYSEYYGMYVQWAVNEDIVHGYDDGTFKPNNNIIEEHLAILVKNAGLTELPDCIDATSNANANRAQMAVAMYALMLELG